MSERGWSWVIGHFRIHSEDQGQQTGYPRQGQAWLLLGPLANVADGRTKAKEDYKCVHRSMVVFRSVVRMKGSDPLCGNRPAISKQLSLVFGSSGVLQPPTWIPKLPQRHVVHGWLPDCFCCVWGAMMGHFLLHCIGYVIPFIPRVVWITFKIKKNYFDSLVQ